MKALPNQAASESAPSKRDCNPAVASMADALKVRIQAGEIVAATDCPEADRLLFWAAIAKVRDEMPCVRPAWRTIGEQHVDGLRVRQKMFRIVPHQKGVIDATLAATIALAAVSALMLLGWLA